MSPKGRLLRSTAVALALGLAAGPLAQAAPVDARVLGVVAAPTSMPLDGARVHLAGGGGRSFVSRPSRADGTFALDGVTPGAYHVAVESRGGLYTVASPLVLAPGQTRSVHLQVQPTPAAPPPEGSSKGKNVWSNPLYASLLVVGVAVVAGVIIQQTTADSSPPIVSPSNP